VCNGKRARDLLQYVEEEIINRGLDAQVSRTGCLKTYTHGPAMVIYPAGRWHGDMSEEKLDAVLPALEAGSPCLAI